ncbi:MAG: hypothetical protein K0R63_977 [Rickettsiales bacterium]|jgi:ankyrin repeat protein|nr:hypothetical protein [Rickettsiales bacterium]
MRNSSKVNPENSIFGAIDNNDTQAIEKILASNPELLNAFVEGKGYPLKHAAMSGKVNAVECLIRLGADVNVGEPYTPLALAAFAHGGDEKYDTIIGMLKDAGGIIPGNENKQLNRVYKEPVKAPLPAEQEYHSNRRSALASNANPSPIR